MGLGATFPNPLDASSRHRDMYFSSSVIACESKGLIFPVSYNKSGYLFGIYPCQFSLSSLCRLFLSTLCVFKSVNGSLNIHQRVEFKHETKPKESYFKTQRSNFVSHIYSGIHSLFLFFAKGENHKRIYRKSEN